MNNIEQSIKESFLSMPVKHRVILVVGGSLLLLLAIWFAVVQLTGWWHGKQYSAATAASDQQAATAETAGDMNVGAADEIRKRLDVLQDEQKKLEQRVKETETALATAHEQSQTTRTVYVTSKQKKFVQRTGADVVSDAALRADSARAAAAINKQ